MNKTLKKVIDIALIGLIILGVTIISSYVYLYNGIAGGDDISFHLGNIYDTYYGIKNGLSIDSTNHLVLGIYGYNTHLFYAPLPHYFAAILMLIFNVSTIESVKLSVSFFCFIGATFFYLFAKKITNNVLLSLVAMAFFVFCPYRMFCGYCRFAYAETLAISFLPILFYGIYSIIHDKKPNYLSFASVILGVVTLVLSHPFTAMIAVIVALLYMALHYKEVWNFLKDKRGLILSIATVITIFALIGFYLFPMMIGEKTGLYRISDHNAVWITYSHVANSTANSWDFSGFLNLDWLKGRWTSRKWPIEFSPNIMVLGIFLILLSAVIVVTIDTLLPKLIKNKYIVASIAVVSSVLPIIFMVQRIEIYLALILFDVIYFISKYFALKEETIEADENDFVKINKESLKDIIFLGVITTIILILIFVGQAWFFLPEIFYNCQFAWRLWSIITILASWLFVLLIDYLSKLPSKILLGLAFAIPSILIASSMCYPEKRTALTYEEAGARVYETWGEEETMNINRVGAMNEYIPVIYYDNTYQSEYENSLYKKIKNSIGNHNNYVHTVDKYISPAFLTGEGTLTCVELNVPNVTFEATINEDSLVQIPQFYYDGYEISLFTMDNEYISNVEVINVDSLVSFNIKEGEYIVKVSYKGTKVRQAFNVIFYFGVAGLAAITTFGVIDIFKKKEDIKE